MKRSGSSIIFLNSRNEVLLLQRDDRADIAYPNMWDLPGGHVDEGETPESCIVREMREEIETDVSACRRYAVYDFEDRVEHIFLMELDVAAETIPLHEGQRLRWFAAEEIEGLPLAYGFDLVLSEFFASTKNHCPMDTSRFEAHRYFLKDFIRQTFDFSETDQNRRIPPPPVEKPCDPQAEKKELPKIETLTDIGHIDLRTAIAKRQSCRTYGDRPLSLGELSFLLWSTQGIRVRLDAGHALRTVPSAGCRHAFETYLSINRVTGLEQGIYRYLPLEHQLLFEFAEENLERRITRAALGQQFAAEAALTFIWTVIPYRMEWRYGPAAHKVIALDAGHVCQNLYLACEAIDAGTCAIAAYDQDAMDSLLRVDGKEEFTIYLAPVGKKP